MYEPIQEKISVVGIYTRAKFRPAKFKWQTQEYPVETITLTHDVRDGGVAKRYFSVLSQGNLYRLCFNRDTEVWTLEAVWCE